MKNNIFFFIISFTMCLFWLVLYLVGKQMIAAYLAIAFGLVAILILSWILFMFLITVSVQSSEEIEKLRNKSLVKKTV